MEKLQLHYYLENGVHSMNAITKNRSEADLLKLLIHVSKSLELDIEFEVEALEEGGIKEFFKAINKKKNKNILIVLAYFGGIFTDVLTGVITDYFNTNSEIEKLEKEERQLNIERLKLEIEKLKTSTEEKEIEQVVKNIKIHFLIDGKTKILKSNYFSQIINEPRITQISTLELSFQNEVISDEKIVTRSKFKNFIIEEINLDPKIITDAEIEIISPVFKKGNDNWKGILNEELINFKIGDYNFKQKVLNRQVSFTTGSKIICELEIKLVLDKKGEPKVKSIHAYEIRIKP